MLDLLVGPLLCYSLINSKLNWFGYCLKPMAPSLFHLCSVWFSLILDFELFSLVAVAFTKTSFCVLVNIIGNNQLGEMRSIWVRDVRRFIHLYLYLNFNLKSLKLPLKLNLRLFSKGVIYLKSSINRF